MTPTASKLREAQVDAAGRASERRRRGGPRRSGFAGWVGNSASKIVPFVVAAGTIQGREVTHRLAASVDAIPNRLRRHRGFRGARFP